MIKAQVQRLKALMEKMENEAANSRLESDMVRKWVTTGKYSSLMSY